MCTVLERKTCEIFEIIANHEDDGINMGGLIIELSKRNSSFLFNPYVSLDDLLETNLIVGRLDFKELKGIYIITAKGKNYYDYLRNHVCNMQAEWL